LSAHWRKLIARNIILQLLVYLQLAKLLVRPLAEANCPKYHFATSVYLQLAKLLVRPLAEANCPKYHFATSCLLAISEVACPPIGGS
jgi:hypothetical protein